MADLRAVLDLGSNSTRYLLVDCTGIGPTGLSFSPRRVVARGNRITRAGESLALTNSLSATALSRIMRAVSQFDQEIKMAGGSWAGAVATSACRRAENRQQLFDSLNQLIGVVPRLISGENEAWLTARGAQLALPQITLGAVLDIGGGSTEFLLFDNSGKIDNAISYPVGVVTLAEQFIRGDSWDQEQEGPLRRQLQQLCQVRGSGTGPLVVVGGTGTTAVAYKQQLKNYNPAVVHGQTLELAEIELLKRQFSEVNFNRLAKHPMIGAGRADLLMPGLLIIQYFMEQLSASRVIISDLGLLVGFIDQLLEEEKGEGFSS